MSLDGEGGVLSEGEVVRERLADPGYLPSFDEVMDSVQNHGLRLDTFGEKHGIYEYLNKEYLSALGDHLRGSIADIAAKKHDKVKILEVGAGSGRLSHFLSTEELQDQTDTMQIGAVDDGSWGVKRRFPVGIMPQAEALETYAPDIVLSAWRPNNVDWTTAFQKTPSVQEYILIGDVSRCGTPEDYAMPEVGPMDEWEFKNIGGFTNRVPTGYEPSFQRNGFNMHDLPDLHRLQIGFSDRMVEGKLQQYSHTVSFRRTPQTTSE